jgi:hypothetical protein
MFLSQEIFFLFLKIKIKIAFSVFCCLAARKDDTKSARRGTIDIVRKKKFERKDLKENVRKLFSKQSKKK